ncbi:MAG: Hydrolase, alpha/beta fold family [Rhodanobacteraceae bacterium]|jgi:pimeloyl-ACP methyl ester carboxylesterase|nr:MAG: Hydrolase, alpha/beta fold family [Rhodanobacteraceae bacterium]
MSNNPARDALLARFAFRLKVLGGLIIALAVIGLAVYFIAPRVLLRGAIAWQAWRDGLHRQAVQVGDTRWVYLEGGKQGAPTLVLLHGYGGTYADWLLAARYLTGNFRVIIPDLPGWGASTRIPDADYGYAAQVDRLHGFVDALHLGEIALAGHSMGGAIAGLYAAKYPKDVAALVLVDSAGVRFKPNAFVRELKSGKSPFDIDNRAEFQHLESLLFAKPPSVPPRIQDVFVDKSKGERAFDDKVLRTLTAPDERDALQAKLPDITAPTLAIWCMQDQVIDVSALDAIRKGLTHAPNIGVTELTGCGHMSIMEKPREVAQSITHFVLLP